MCLHWEAFVLGLVVGPSLHAGSKVIWREFKAWRTHRRITRTVRAYIAEAQRRNQWQG